jgi:two-component system chemotaxis response regulator CheB
VLVVLHVAPGSPSVLPQILARAGALDATHAVDGAEARPGCIYVAPPDRHLVVVDGHLRLDEGPPVNRHRPAIDTLFLSAAAAYAAESAGVILSGVLRDGTEGLLAIKRAGGMTFVQDPADALYPAMPQSAIDAVQPNRVGTAHDLGVAIAEAVRQPAGLP